MKAIALLPMKANSQRVPGKNFKDFCGKPLFRWMLDTLLSVEQIEQIVINTDAQKELENCGITSSDRVLVQCRADVLRGDEVSMNKILEADISKYAADVYFMTHTTNPFLSANTILQAFESYHAGLSEGYDSLFSVDRVQMRFFNKKARPLNHDPDNLIQTQDLEPWFAENSNFYIFSEKSFKAANARIGLKPKMFVSSRLESVDIDTPDDWVFAEALGNSNFFQE